MKKNNEEMFLHILNGESEETDSRIPEPELAIDTANQILNNVYASCEQDPNPIPLEVLEDLSHCNTKNYRRAGIFLGIILIFVLCLPLLFIKPTISLSKHVDESYDKATYSFLTEGRLFPVTTVIAEVDGNRIPVTKEGGGAFHVSTVENGTLTITAISANRQRVETQIPVSCIDKTRPDLITYTWNQDYLYITVKDDNSGIDAKHIFAYTTKKKKILPASWDPETSTVAFAMPSDSLNIYIPDFAGNTLHTLLSFQ